MELGTCQFYSLLMSDIEQLCENPPRAHKRGDVEPDLLCLAFRLSNLDKDWSKFIPFRYTWRIVGIVDGSTFLFSGMTYNCRLSAFVFRLFSAFLALGFRLSRLTGLVA